MLNILNKFIMLIIIFSLYGCAHPIVVSPDSSKIVRNFDSPRKINLSAGYFIPAENINLEVTTPGGGGDNVRYFPYKDLESGYQRMLLNVFDNVVKLNSPDDIDEVYRNRVSYILSPDLITSSGSTGFFTWPPTNFTVDLTTKIVDSSGRTLGTPRVVGNGQASGIYELKGDFGLAGRRAMEDALIKMQSSLLNFEYGGTKNTPITVPDRSPGEETYSDSIVTRLEKLNDLFDRRLISRDELLKKREDILNSL